MERVADFRFDVARIEYHRSFSAMLDHNAFHGNDWCRAYVVLLLFQCKVDSHDDRLSSH